MKTIGNRVLVTKVEEVKKEGEFETVTIQDAFVYKGRIEQVGEKLATEPYPQFITSNGTGGMGAGNIMSPTLQVGSIILFAKYSPDTHEIEHEGVKYKFVAFDDILAIL